MDTTKIAPSMLKTKQHFEVPDGLRGVAALSVNGMTILVVLAAYMIMILYDIPVRKYLTDKRKERLQRSAAINLLS